MVNETSAAAKSTRSSCVLGLTVVPAINCGSCRGQHNACLLASVSYAENRVLASRAGTTKLKAELPRASSNIISMLHLFPTLDCYPLCRCGAFPFAVYPRLQGHENSLATQDSAVSLQTVHPSKAIFYISVPSLTTSTAQGKGGLIHKLLASVIFGPQQHVQGCHLPLRYTAHLGPGRMPRKDSAPSGQVTKTVLLMWVSQ